MCPFLCAGYNFTLAFFVCVCIITSMIKQTQKGNDMTIQTQILEGIFTEMEKHGFSHVAYGTVFEKDGVEVHFGEYDSHVYSLSSHSFDGPEGNHHTKCTIHKALVYVHWSETYESISQQMAERAVKLAEKH